MTTKKVYESGNMKVERDKYRTGTEELFINIQQDGKWIHVIIDEDSVSVFRSDNNIATARVKKNGSRVWSDISFRQYEKVD